ncbi:sodium/calcium exchanger 1 [Copidosoma floridanum]|uniref:sodium/calcium exchanger 1 n=1 Tax=Copidosoma floridanum TaxID=29053 RepID=UPI000C6F9E9D|nr:sodium/calcium exchanger 1 [Copidosoma floridanum]
MSGNYSARCEPGLMVPVWYPTENLELTDVVFRGTVYFLSMMYLFIGVSIISDRFMAAIEVITSKEKELVVKRPGKEPQIVIVRVWNETVANLTLMALGSSAPEILLSIIEIYAKNFQAGELGPGTIVGSAAYNLFVIISLCVFVIPNGEVRKIKHLRVFFVTATWSIFAYVWMYYILAVSSPGVLEVWEGLLTFSFFPATVLTAYIADRRLLIYKYLHKGYRMNKRGVIVEAEARSDSDNGVELEIKAIESQPTIRRGHNGSIERYAEAIDDTPESREFEQTRRDYIRTLKELRKRHPQLALEQLEVMAHEEVLGKGPKSRAFYRVQATRKMVGAGNLSRKISERAQSDLSEVKAELQRAEAESVDIDNINATRVYFEPGHYTVMENVGTFEVGVTRVGGDLNRPCTVDYSTEDGTAEAGSDYVSVRGTLKFEPGETRKTIKLSVIDDELFEEDEHFYVRLTNCSQPAMLASPSLATVMILDDDHSGIFGFPERDYELVESIGHFHLKVIRYSGARGRVVIGFRTVEGTAKPGKQYVHAEDSITFEDNQTEKIIELGIIEEDSYEKDALFYVELSHPQLQGAEAGLAAAAEMKAPEERTEEEKMALLGRPRLGDIARAQIRIKESKEFKNTVDKLVQRANASLILGTSSWKEQFTEALTVSGGDDDEEGGAEEGADAPARPPSSPSVGDYLMHFITIFWKVLFAFVPPTDIAGGYICFIVSIFGIGVVTAIIGDVASYFGCTLGIKDSVTAILFVALGTSIPDTFASKVAACQDKYADASVGNVTGSNAVNVFLGIGIAWSIAAMYHAYHGNTFEVEPGSLAFSVTLFCTEASVVIIVLMIRRTPSIGGELGGPKVPKYITSIFLFSLWIFYLVMSSLEAYGVIQGF